MKKCRTLNGLLKSIQNKETCCFEYTTKASTRGGYIIYHKNGTNVIVHDATYKTIKPYLHKV